LIYTLQLIAALNSEHPSVSFFCGWNHSIWGHLQLKHLRQCKFAVCADAGFRLSCLTVPEGSCLTALVGVLPHTHVHMYMNWDETFQLLRSCSSAESVRASKLSYELKYGQSKHYRYWNNIDWNFVLCLCISVWRSCVSYRAQPSDSPGQARPIFGCKIYSGRLRQVNSHQSTPRIISMLVPSQV